jgi:Uma2 family endonuclease
VTPPPSYGHEDIGANLTEILVPYVRTHDLGKVYRPHAVMRHEGSQVEPDLMVRARHPNPTGKDADWNTAPIPILVVEIASPYTRRRDRAQKRQLYLDAGVAEYWIVDPESREVHIIRPDGEPVATSDRVTWWPAGASEALAFDVSVLFRESL